MQRSKYVQRATYLYVRVSTDEQAKEGVSLGAQEERLRAYAVATSRGKVIVVKDEGASAKSLDRPGLTRILSDVRLCRAESLIVLKLDRLTRSVRDLSDLLDMFSRTSTSLVSVTESLDTASASGRLMLNLLASVSQWEREAIGERTAFALAHKRKRFEVYGPVPYGYRREGTGLVLDIEAQAILREIRLRREKGESIRRIISWLNETNVRTPRGGSHWYPNTLYQLLTSKMYVSNMHETPTGSR